MRYRFHPDDPLSAPAIRKDQKASGNSTIQAALRRGDADREKTRRGLRRPDDEKRRFVRDVDSVDFAYVLGPSEQRVVNGLGREYMRGLSNTQQLLALLLFFPLGVVFSYFAVVPLVYYLLGMEVGCLVYGHPIPFSVPDIWRAVASLFPGGAIAYGSMAKIDDFMEERGTKAIQRVTSVSLGSCSSVHPAIDRPRRTPEYRLVASATRTGRKILASEAWNSEYLADDRIRLNVHEEVRQIAGHAQDLYDIRTQLEADNTELGNAKLAKTDQVNLDRIAEAIQGRVDTLTSYADRLDDLDDKIKVEREQRALLERRAAALESRDAIQERMDRLAASTQVALDHSSDNIEELKVKLAATSEAIDQIIKMIEMDAASLRVPLALPESVGRGES